MPTVADRSDPDESAQVVSATDVTLSRYCKALAHPARIHILRLLLGQQECLCGDLVASMPLAQSTISQHLKVLKDAGLIIGTVDGPRRRYCVAPQALEELRSLLSALKPCC